MAITERSRDWWLDKWWLEEEYVRLYQNRASPDEVDQTICRLAEIFDAEWERENRRHPLHTILRARGTLPLSELHALAYDLAVLKGSLRLPSVIHDLRQASHFESARLEVQVAAHLKQKGHLIAFRPPLPNGRESDLVARLGSEEVYFEIKRLSASAVQRAVEHLTHRVALALSDFVRSLGPEVGFRKYTIELDSRLKDLLGGDSETDEAVIETAATKIVSEVAARCQENPPVNFTIRGFARVLLEEGGQAGSGVTGPPLTSEAELNAWCEVT